MAAGLGGLRVLVVEDEALVGLDVEQMLGELGCEVVRWSNASIDVAGLAALSVDAAVLDVALADETSYPLAELLTQLGVPFIFATGYDSVDDRFRLVPLIEKPFDREDLATALSRALGQQKDR
jgi:CheY-like chemotaxis protein